MFHNWMELDFYSKQQQGDMLRRAARKRLIQEARRAHRERKRLVDGSLPIPFPRPALPPRTEGLQT